MLAGIVDDLGAGLPVATIAAAFHGAVADLIAAAAARVRDETGVTDVVLTGGVFQNVLLVGLARRALDGRGFRVLTHHLVPPNNSGLSALGQATVAGYRAPDGTGS